LLIYQRNGELVPMGASAMLAPFLVAMSPLQWRWSQAGETRWHPYQGL
jgi:hypothetical protein